MGFNWTKIVSGNHLAVAMQAYEQRFGHAVPSAAIKSASLSGSTSRLTQKINCHLKTDTPDEQWMIKSARLGEELINHLT